MNRLAWWLLLFLFVPRAGLAQTTWLSVPWVELGGDAQLIARVIVNTPADCPSILLDGQARRMAPRTPVPDGFRPVCEASIPRATRAASINGRRLRLPRRTPRRIVAFGDTGCRINAEQVQDCNSADQWPFARVAERAAATRPDLVIHVGDYLYREVPCPPDKPAFCGGTPNGDSWEAWNADFFTPAAKLLRAAPWVVARGNHETCQRSWRGWFYYLDPRPWAGAACEGFTAPYVARVGAFQIVVLDSSSVSAMADPQQARTFAAELGSVKVSHAWLVDHHPFWLISADQAGQPQPLTLPLQDAWREVAPRGIDLILSGHVHLFQALGFEDQRPPQLVVGTGGTALNMAINDPVHAAVGGTRIVSSETHEVFGYLLLTKTAERWTATLRTAGDHTVVRCAIAEGRINCQTPREPAS